MTISDIFFYLFIGGAALSGVGMLLVKNVLHAALLLIVCLLSLAGLYVLLHAEFLAVTQIMVYAGGVLVVIIFGVMLSSRIAGKPLRVDSTRKFPGVLVGFVLFLLLTYAIRTTLFFSTPPATSGMTPVRETGFKLMTTHVIPFEFSGVLLLISLVGSAITASYFTRKNTDAR